MKYLVDILVPEAMPGFWGDVVFIRLYQFFVVGNVVTGNIVEIDFLYNSYGMFKMGSSSSLPFPRDRHI